MWCNTKSTFARPRLLEPFVMVADMRDSQPADLEP